MQREIILDTETTGLDPKQGHRIIEIGCVEMINHFLTGKTFHVYINPERDVPIEAYEVHNISTEFLADKPKFKEIADDFLNFIEGGKLVIHNAPFDIGFLNFELGQLKKPLIDNKNVVDSLVLARQKHPGAQNNLDALCRRYGIDNSRRTKHGALLDAEILSDVYIELLDLRQSDLMSVSRPEVVEEIIEETINIDISTLKKGYGLEDKDKKNHQEFIKTLGDNTIWQKYLN